MNVARRTKNAERRGLLILWCLLIVLIVVPWYDFQDHLHWGNVVWRPFIDPPWRLLDAILNTLLYVPLGVWARRTGVSRYAVLLGAAVSLLTEATQLFSHSRVPSMTDVACNVTGAFCGTWITASRPTSLKVGPTP